METLECLYLTLSYLKLQVDDQMSSFDYRVADIEEQLDSDNKPVYGARGCFMNVTT